MFNINNPDDVVSISSAIIGMDCSLYEVENDSFLVKTKYGEVHAIPKSNIKKIIDKDKERRIQTPGDRILVLGSNTDYQTLPFTFLKSLYASGIKITIYSPNKIIAPIPAHYISDSNEPINKSNINNTVMMRPENSAVIGKTMIDGIAVLATDLDSRLVENCDQLYIDSLRGRKVYVVDEFSQFLLSIEGIEAEIL